MSQGRVPLGAPGRIGARMRPHLAAVPARPPALYVACGPLLVAIDSAHVVRAALCDEVEATAASAGTAASWRVTFADGEVPGWDLQAALGCDGEAVAWVLVRSPHPHVPRFALRTGRCLGVRPMPAPVALPARWFGARQAAVRGGFAAPAVPELVGYPTGLVFDPTHFLQGDELRGLAAGVTR